MNSKRWFTGASVLFVIAMLAACGGGGGGGSTAAPPPDHSTTTPSITVFPSASSIVVGQTRQYTAVVKDTNGNILSGVTVGWSSSDQGVATIDSSGLAQGLGLGTTTITASQNGIKSQLVNLSVTSVPVSSLTPLPPWFSYCDTEPCTSITPVVVYACPAGSPQCTPARSTTIIPQVDDKPISGVVFRIVAPFGTPVRLVSGDGTVVSSSVMAYQTSKVILASTPDVLLSSYEVAPVWGGTTLLNFTSTLLSSALLDTVFYSHPSYDTGTVATDLHAQAQTVIMTLRTMTGLTSEHVTALFLPTELYPPRDVALGYGGSTSFGNGMVTTGYGHPSSIGNMSGVIAIFAHEYAHELFNEIRPAPAGGPGCLNEGVADALPYVAGFLPEWRFGPVGEVGTNFDSSCTALSRNHDVGKCYFWHVKKAGLLTPSFLHGIFHPQHSFNFNSCAQNTIETGNNILVYFTEAAGGTDMVPVLDSMQIPHAGSYEAAKQALGL